VKIVEFVGILGRRSEIGDVQVQAEHDVRLTISNSQKSVRLQAIDVTSGLRLSTCLFWFLRRKPEAEQQENRVHS
jgi:hypothetical protein